jgi:hypothetical protein
MSSLANSVSYPSPGVIRVRSDALFGGPEGPTCRRFIERAFQSKVVISSVAIAPGESPRADLHDCPRTFALSFVLPSTGGPAG